ncbi:hypothetical protein IID26_00100 [Patescibacteria group bacterium]|nr:hypothetical protein [Patescibacteria group bacterium]
MLKKLLLTLVLMLVSSMTFAGQFAIPQHSVIAQRGDTVLGTWWSLHHIGFEAIGINQNAYCDIFRARNAQFFSINTRGCTNSGFNKLGTGVVWNIPIPPVKLVAASGEVIILAERPDGSLVPEIMSQEEVAIAGAMATEREMSALQVSELKSELLNASDTIVENESEIRALEIVVGQYRQAEESTSLLAKSLGIVGLLSATLIAVGAALLISLYPLMKRKNRKLAAELEEVKKSRDALRSTLEGENKALMAKIKEIRNREKRLRRAILRTNVLLELPSDLRQVDGLDVYLPILRFVDKDVNNIPVVYLLGAPNGIVFDNPKKVWKHLSEYGEAAEKSRRQLGIERCVVTLRSGQDVAQLQK